MSRRLILCLLLLAFALPGCIMDEQAKKAKARQKEQAKAKIPDSSNDTNFQAFIGRLKTAVSKKDLPAIAATMAQDFGWRWEQPSPGTPFEYWDQNNLWPELEKVLHQRFSPSEEYMVSPPEFATEVSYDGPRAGMKLVNGAWRFAYFVTGRDPLP